MIKRGEAMKKQQQRMQKIIKGGVMLFLGCLLLSMLPTMTFASTPKTFHYVKRIPMPEKQQEYLYGLVRDRGLDYEDTLAVILQESSFDADSIDSGNYGYFQVNRVNHDSLADTLNTKNTPLNPYVNINWGTYMLSSLQEKFEDKGYTGRKLQEAVLSSYNRGENGYKKYGVAEQYMDRHDAALITIQKWMKNSQ